MPEPKSHPECEKCQRDRWIAKTSRISSLTIHRKSHYDQKEIEIDSYGKGNRIGIYVGEAWWLHDHAPLLIELDDRDFARKFAEAILKACQEGEG